MTECLKFESATPEKLEYIAQEINTLLPNYDKTRFYKHLRRALNEFLQVSWAWRYDRELVTLPRGTQGYTYPVLDNAAIFKILELWEVDPVTGREQELPKRGQVSAHWGGGIAWSQMSPWRITFNQALRKEITLRAHVVLKLQDVKEPKLPDEIITIYHEAIFRLAYSYVQLEPEGKGMYYNPVQSNVDRAIAMKEAQNVKLDYLQNRESQPDPSDRFNNRSFLLWN